MSLMGVYGAAPDVALYITNIAVPTRLCFAFFGQPSGGKFVFEAELHGPLGRLQAASVPSRLELPLQAAKGAVTIVFWFPSVTFPKPDRYTIALRVDGNPCFESTFEIIPALQKIPSLG
ncbi:MAG: hypothetical protein WAN23_15490 [Candidatus Acidiferrales bacterium]